MGATLAKDPAAANGAGQCGPGGAAKFAAPPPIWRNFWRKLILSREVLVLPAGVQKSNVCFTCCSRCSYGLDTILSNTVPLVWAESQWIAGK